MKVYLSLLMITKNGEKTIEKTLYSVKNLVDEIVIVDNYSSDKTITIAKEYQSKVFFYKGKDLGKQAKLGLNKCQGEWILVLDSDEYLSSKLKREIKKILDVRYSMLQKYTGFYIPFQNYFLGRPVMYGGENYKMLRLFKKDSVDIKPAIVHHKYFIKKGKIGYLKAKIIHHSYRSLPQMIEKFTEYARREAKQKLKRGEKSSLKKIFFYPLHMFWARFIEDKGYKDGLFRIPLDLGFAYMEFLTYFFLFIFKLKRNFFYINLEKVGFRSLKRVKYKK